MAKLHVVRNHIHISKRLLFLSFFGCLVLQKYEYSSGDEVFITRYIFTLSHFLVKRSLGNIFLPSGADGITKFDLRYKEIIGFYLP